MTVGRNRFLTAGLVLALLLSLEAAMAQAPVDPQRTQLLNGLRVVHLPKAGDPNVFIKLRIHSGAAFDLAGKEGTLALLGDILFPDPNVREYFTDEMQGRLNVKTDYDSLTITMQGRAAEFERMIEILRTAIVTTQLTPENVAKVRDGRIKVVRETSISPAAVADRAIATRLFGDFPYGRPYGGTPESLERVERSDLMLARERFLNPNNATLTIIGGVQPGRAMRALRQLLGIWRKSEQVVPATFRQPTKPDIRTLIVNGPADQSVEVRLAVRGLARRDPETFTANLLANVVRARWENTLPELSRSPVFVRHDAFALPGMFVMGTTIDHLLAGKALKSAEETLKALATAPVTPSELEQAKSELLAVVNKELGTADGLTDAWLDIDTYGAPSSAELINMINSITPAEMQRTAGRIFSPGAFATVVVGNSDVLKNQLEAQRKIEIMGAMESKTDNDQNQKKTNTATGSKPE